MSQGNAAEVGMVVPPEATNKTIAPSKGYFHVLQDEHNPRWATLVRTGVPMGLLAFTRRIRDMVPGVHYFPVGSVNASIAEACVVGLELTNDGLYAAHADALAQAKKAALKENYVRAVMYDEASGGWWVQLSGARRFMNWRQLGLFSSTVALFTDWSQLSAMQYDPAETDISDLVRIDVTAMLRNANISLVKLKRPPSWTCREATKPYLHKAGKDRAPGPIDYDTLPVPQVRQPEYHLPYLGEPGALVHTEAPQVAADIPDHLRDIPEHLARRLMPTPMQVAQQPAQQFTPEPMDTTWEHPILAGRKQEGFWND